MTDTLFVSWAPFCSRSDTIARELGGRSVMIYHGFWGSRYSTVLFKYASQALATLWLLARTRPRTVFVMCPPAAACVPVWLYAKLARASYLIDAHTATFVDARWKALAFVQRFFCREARTTLVTNTHWQSLIESWHARSDIVADVPVAFPAPRRLELAPGPKIAVVCTFTFDEPVAAMFEAARLAPEVALHFTGNPKRLGVELLARKPANVHLMGFLPDDEYVGLLTQCTAVMSLTTLDHTMQRGAYEAAYLGRPIITSNFALLRGAFPRGTVFVEATPQSIAAGVRTMCADAERYAREAVQLAEEKRRNWRTVKASLKTLVKPPDDQ
jgi:glycosyltransferase involved in cell wall biosynthesis